MESSFSKAAKGVAVAGAAVGAALGVALVGAISVEKANDRLAAQLGLTQRESERVGSVAGSLFSQAYGGSLEEVNTAVGAVISSIDGMRGASSSTLESVSKNALDFAAIFGTDVESAVASVSTLMRSGLAPDAQTAFDLITAASQRVPAALRENVLEASNEYGQFFNTLGFSGEQAFALLVDASAKGEFGIDKVGDAIKEFTIRSTDMSTSSRDAYSAIGLDAETMANRILAGGNTAQGATQQIIDGLLSMTNPSEQAAAAIALFGTPLEDLNTAEIPAFLQSMQGASTSMEGWRGSIERAGQALGDNAATRIEAFKNQVTTAFIDIVGNQILPIVSAFALFLATNFGPALAAVGTFLSTVVVPALQSFGQWLYDARVPLGIVAGIITAVFLPSLIALAVQSTITAVTTTASWLATQAGAIGAAAIHSVAIGMQVAGWVALRVASLASALGVAAAWLLAIGPIGLVIAAVVAVVALVVANWDTVRSVTEAVFGWIGNFIGQVWAAITAFFVSGTATVSGAWNGFWSGVQAVAMTVWNAIAGFLSTVWAAISAGFSAATGFLSALWSAWWAGISAVASTVWGFVRGYIDTVWQVIKGLFTAATALLRGDWDGFWSALRSTADTAFGTIRSFIDTVWGAIRGFFSTGTTTISGVWSGFWSGLSSVTSTVFGAIRSTIDTVIAGITGAFRTVVGSITTIWGGIRAALARPVNFMINTVYNGGIVRAWNFVAGLIPGIGPIGTIPGIPEFAKGGPVLEDTLLRAGEAGPEYILSADAVAGLGGIDAVDRLHRRAVREPIELSTLNSGKFVEGADHNGPGTSTVGFGGVKPHVAQAGHYLKNRFGIASVGGVGQRANASDHPRGLALDFMTYSDTAKGDRLVNYLVPNAGHFAVKYIIWKQRINSGSGWRGMEDRGSVTANHFDHPHVSFLDGPGGGGGFSGEGGEFLNPLPGLVRAFFDTFVNPLVAAIPGGPPKFLDIPKGAVGFARDSALKFFLGLVGGDTAFDRGGVAFGKGLLMKDVIEPERVLSPRETVAFEQLVASLPTAPTTSLPAPGTPSELAPGGPLDRRLGELIEAVRAQPRVPNMTVQTMRDPVETARAIQLALRP